ncbi:MAG: hypothetical protein DRQ44_16245, partial [Gammaproteobacteria bacterium]
QIKNNFFCSNSRVGTLFYTRIGEPFRVGKKACPPYETFFILKSFYLRSSVDKIVFHYAGINGR